MRIIAFEAIPEKAAALRDAFPTVEVHECAVGDSEKAVSFFVYDRQSGFSSLRMPSAATMGQAREINVEMKTLDQIVSADDVDVVKIDGGAEQLVLNGGSELISRARPLIMFESGARPTSTNLSSYGVSSTNATISCSCPIDWHTAAQGSRALGIRRLITIHEERPTISPYRVNAMPSFVGALAKFSKLGLLHETEIALGGVEYRPFYAHRVLPGRQHTG